MSDVVSSFQSEQVIADELGSLTTCLTVTSIKEDNPAVSFPPINKSTEVGSPPHLFAPSIVPQEARKSSLESPAVVSLPGSSSNLLAGEGVLTSGSAVFPYEEQVSRFLAVLQDAVQRRVSRAPPVVQRTEATLSPAEGAELGDMTGGEAGTISSVGGAVGVLEGRARIAVLFSGGVDSAVLAALVDRCWMCVNHCSADGYCCVTGVWIQRRRLISSM